MITRALFLLLLIPILAHAESWVLWRRIHWVGNAPTWRTLEAMDSQAACETGRQRDMVNRLARAKEWVDGIEKIIPGKIVSWRASDEGLIYTTTRNEEIWVSYSCWPASTTPTR